MKKVILALVGVAGLLQVGPNVPEVRSTTSIRASTSLIRKGKPSQKKFYVSWRKGRGAWSLRGPYTIHDARQIADGLIRRGYEAYVTDRAVR